MNVVDSTGTVQNNYDYEIYGMGKVATENGLKNPVRYAGEYFDEESGLYYLRGRYYSPDTMRFISEDSYKGEIGSPLSLNLYAYCAGNPIEYSDPSGHMRGYKQPICDMDTSAPPVVTPKPKSTFQSVKESVQATQAVSDMMLPIAISSVTSKGDSESKMATAAAVLAAEAEIKAGASIAEQKIVNVIKGAGNAKKIPWGNWNDYEKVTVTRDGIEQTYAKIGDRLYSKHAVDRMQPSGNRYGSRIEQAGGDYGRSVAPQYVEDVLNSTKPVPQENGNLSYTSDSLQVITNPQGDVVTIITK